MAFEFQDEYTSAVGVDDLVLLPKLSNDSIMENLAARAQREIIYSYIGHVLLAVNPYKKLDIYGQKHMEKYRGRQHHELAPHVYMTAENAFNMMLMEEENQCVIISGESGAGKTESAKKIMNYIAYVSKQAAGVEEVKRIILGSNPLLEAFGNAKTLRNNNSSRFGKYVELRFDMYGAPCGGHVRNYLLEKSRLGHQIKGERNFHVFYQLTMGGNEAIKEALGITGPEDFHYLSQSKCTKLAGVDEKKAFEETREAMRMVGLKGRAQEAIFKLLAGLLHLGNIDFVEEGQGCTISKGCKRSVTAACKLLGLDQALLAHALCFRHMKTVMEEFDVPLNPLQARVARDALAKALYANLFDFLVSRVNDALETVHTESSTDTLSINVLDIYGFEIFQQNGFEQFLINFVNEKLQQLFIELTLKQEQDEYEREQVKWTPIKFFDNKVVCDLIESKRPAGLLAILDDTCATLHAESKGADDKFVQKASEHHHNHKHFTGGGAGFSITHYAGVVEYTKHGFTGANKDTLSSNIVKAVKASSVKFVRSLFPDSKKSTTVGFKMKQQCASLVDALMNCEAHYVRCLKPNDDKKPGAIDRTRLSHQIKYLGLLENTRVRRAGYAYKQEFHHFNSRYQLLVPSRARRGKSDKEICQKMLKFLAKDLELKAEDVAMGKTKLFLKHAETLSAAENLRLQRLDGAAKIVQQAWKKYKNMEHLIKLRLSANKYVSKHKKRRRESLIRPFSAFYLKYNKMTPLRSLIEPWFQHDQNEQPIFTEEMHITPLDGKGVVGNCFFVLTARAFYIVDHWKQQLPPISKLGKHPLNDIHRLRRVVPLTSLTSLSMSTLADNYIVLHNKPQPPKKLVEWAPNAAKLCGYCKNSFGWFGRKHHCRQCGQVFCSDCCPDRVCTLPYRGVYEPTRVCFDCVGKEPTDMGGDIVLKTSRKTELMALLMDTLQSVRQLPLKFSDVISCRVCVPAPDLKSEVVKEVSVKVKQDDGMSDLTGGKLSATKTGGWVIVAPPGVPQEVLDRQKKIDAQKKRQREKQRQEEMAERKRLEEERQRQREAERKARIREKKARKAKLRKAKEAEAAAAAEKIAKRGGRAPPVSSKAAAKAPKVPPCSSCDCDDYQKHPFKNSCANCFHAH
eukprot:m.141155 g.141155  ORF g.141155 m.141155 type:complete len:1134 (+) comp24137_c0_seq2:61-3462(+)